MKRNRTSVRSLVAAMLAVASLLPAAQAAEPFPVKPVTIVVPFPPGGGALEADIAKSWDLMRKAGVLPQ